MTNDWVDSLPRVSRDDPNVVNIEVPSPEHIEKAASPTTLRSVLAGVHELNTEARALFMLHSKAVRGQLLNSPKARFALDKLLWELAKDEELGDELRKQNPIRYSKTPEVYPQS